MSERSVISIRETSLIEGSKGCQYRFSKGMTLSAHVAKKFPQHDAAALGQLIARGVIERGRVCTLNYGQTHVSLYSTFRAVSPQTYPALRPPLRSVHTTLWPVNVMIPNEGEVL